MGGLSIITSTIIAIIELLIFLSPFILGWIVYSYIFSKLIYSFAKHYFNINISFSRTWAITFLSGMITFIIDIILFISYNSILSALIIWRISAVVVFIVSLIIYKSLSNVSLKAAIVISLTTILAYISFIIVVYIIVNYVLNVLLNPNYDRVCCTLNYVE
ncbi:MAG: hypothetical protein RXQ93_07875 [Caldisphaera sp.]